MNNGQKKTAPEAATPETESNNNITTSSIAEKEEKIKVVLKLPGEISRVTWITGSMNDILTGGVTDVTIPENGLKLVMNMHNHRNNAEYNLRTLWGRIYGAVIVTAMENGKYISLTPEQCQSARAWLLKHSV